MAISAQDVNKLRQLTGAGMMDCKKALIEANGDFELAVDILRKQGQKVAAKRSENATSEGVILIHVNKESTNGKLVALACETEPVANVANFKELAASLLDLAIAKNFDTKETLVASSFADGLSVEERITDLIGKLGEKIEVVDYVNLSAEKIVSYIHSNGKLGVVAAFENTEGADLAEVGKDVAMQVAAMKPVAVDSDDVDTETVERELEIGKEQARGEGKPEAILEKIAQGKLQRFFKENTLLHQEFIKDPSMTIRQLLEKTKKGLKIKAFKRVSIGT